MEKFIRNSFLNLIKYINGLSKPATNFIDKWIPVIHPDGSKIILFEIYFLLIQIMQLYYIPMFVSFDEIKHIFRVIILPNFIKIKKNSL